MNREAPTALTSWVTVEAGKRTLSLFGWVFLLNLSVPVEAHAFTVPKLTSPVVDEAALLSPGVAASLSGVLQRLWQRGGSQVAILTVPTLAGQPIEQVSIAVVDAWKLGKEKEDNGILVIIAKGERKLRIEVGQGLEGVLTDAHSKRIITEYMVPLIRRGDMDGAILVGVNEILRRTDPNFNFRKAINQHLPSSANPLTRENRGLGLGDFFGYGFFGLVILAFLFSRIFGGRGRSSGGYWGGGGWGGFSGGGGGSSWGGFDGGGGGFSGGGASGDW